MSLKYIFIGLTILVALYNINGGDPPPTECYDHMEIFDHTRMFSKHDTPTSSGTDINLKAGWYRVLGEAGNSLKQGFDKILQTGSSPPNFCGTEYAGTLMSEHPTIDEGLVEMTVCFRARYCFFKNIDSCDCFKKIIIYVRNCGKHYVYWLFPTSDKMRYCTGRSGVNGAQRIINYIIFTVVDGKSEAVECKQYHFDDSSSRIWDKVSDVKCDTKTGWYRFKAEAGTEIASKCSVKSSDVTRFAQLCGAEFRGWMIDAHPTLEEGRVQRRICFSYSDQCSCEYFTNIYVRNCGGFFLYRLNEVPFCNARYCGAPSKSLSNVNDVAKPAVIKNTDLCSVYKTLHDPDRLWSYTSPTVEKCDANLYGKYRFGSKYTSWSIIEGCNASDMAIVTHRCGAEYQGYMIGKHPDNKGELVQRVICFQTPKIACNCHHTGIVNVQNCGGFFVYEIKGVPQCNSRYCMVANKSRTIRIDPDRPPLYEIPSPGYNPIVIEEVKTEDGDDGLSGAVTALSIILFLLILLVIFLILVIVFIMWPIYKRRRDLQEDEEELKLSTSNGNLPRDELDQSYENEKPPYPIEPHPANPPSEADSEIEMQRGPGSDDDLHTIPEEYDQDIDEHDTLVKKRDLNKPRHYDKIDSDV